MVDTSSGILKPPAIPFIFNDGGRLAAGYQGQAGDCTCRAVAIAAELDYQEVYDSINRLAKRERRGCRKKRKSSARTGVPISTVRKLLAELGFVWVPTMHIGWGCIVHLRADELPLGRLVVRVSKHVTAVIDRVIYDTHDPSREGTRCVYGYFYRPNADAAVVGP